MKSGNPALNEKAFMIHAATGAEVMTLGGTVNKCIMLTLCLVLSSAYFWINAEGYIQSGAFRTILIGSALGGLIVALITIFKKEWSPITAPIYVVIEGAFIGLFSSMMEIKYPGIAIQAVTLTMGTLFAMLLAYRSGLIRATENFKLGIVAATGGIFVIYMVSMISGLFGYNIPFIHDSGPIGIGFSLVVVVIAALNLVLDFDFIEKGAESHAPKYMEWYAAFGLMVTLIWLYIEMLRLLSKIRSR